MNPTRTLEDFPASFTSKHFKGRTKHSSARHSASETKPLIPTEEFEHDSGHKHIALVLSNSQPDELNQKGTSPVSSSSDIPLTILPAYTSLASHISNRPASHLQKSVSNSDIKAAVSYPDTGFHDISPLGYVHDHTSRSLPRQMSPDVDNVQCTLPAESLKEISRVPTSQPDYCHNDARLLVAQHLQVNLPSEQCSSLADSCMPSVTDNHPFEVSSDQNTAVNSNLSDAMLSISSPSQENKVTCLLNSSYSSDSNKNTMPPPQSPSKDNCLNAGIVLGVGIPEAAYVDDQCTVTLTPQEREPVKVFISRTGVASEEPHQIHLTETRNTKGLSSHNKSCPSNPSSPLLNCPHSSSSHIRNTSPTHQVEQHNASTSMEESAFQLKNRVSGGSNAYHVNPSADVNHTSSTCAFPNSITQAVKPGCHYPAISDKLDVCFCGNRCRIHYPQHMNNHSRHSQPTTDSGCQEILGETTQAIGRAHFCGKDFISTAPYSERRIHSPSCGFSEAVTSQTQHSDLRKPNKCVAHVSDTADETFKSEHDHQNLPGSKSSHSHAHRMYYNTNFSSQGSCDLHPCAVEMASSASHSPAGNLAPDYIKSSVFMSQKATNGPHGSCGPMCHFDQHMCQRNLPYGENCNNIQMADSNNILEITRGSNRACIDGTVLESQENLVVCKRDNDRNSGLLSIDSGHPVNKEGSLPRSNTSEVGLLNISGHGTLDRDVPNYSILCIVATVLNPVFGLAALLCNHYAQINFRLNRRAKANNLYFATITISTVAIFLTLVGAVLLVSHIAVGRSEAKLMATTPSTDECHSRLFGYDESLPKFFDIDFQLYCEITKNAKIMDALKRFWLEDIHNKRKFVNIEVKDKVCNDTQSGQSDDVSSVNDTFMGESSSRVNHPFRNLHPAEEHIDSESVTVYTPQLSKPFEDSGSSHNTILSSNDGPVVPPELEEEYRQYLKGHTRIKVASGYPFLHRSTADRTHPAQTTASTEDRPTTDLNITGSNATAT